MHAVLRSHLTIDKVIALDEFAYIPAKVSLRALSTSFAYCIQFHKIYTPHAHLPPYMLVWEVPRRSGGVFGHQQWIIEGKPVGSSRDLQLNDKWIDLWYR